MLNYQMARVTSNISSLLLLTGQFSVVSKVPESVEKPMGLVGTDCMLFLMLVSKH